MKRYLLCVFLLFGVLISPGLLFASIINLSDSTGWHYSPTTERTINYSHFLGDLILDGDTVLTAELVFSFQDVYGITSDATYHDYFDHVGFFGASNTEFFQLVGDMHVFDAREWIQPDQNRPFSLTYSLYPGTLLDEELEIGIYKGDNLTIYYYDYGDFYFESTVNLIVSRPDINPVPEPATMLLLGSGLAGLACIRRRFGKS